MASCLNVTATGLEYVAHLTQLTLVGPKDAPDDVRQGIFVSKVYDDSPAKGLVVPGKRVFAIDGQDMFASPKSAAVRCLHKSGDVVTFVVSAAPDVDGFAQFQAGKKSAPTTKLAARPPANQAKTVEVNKGSGGKLKISLAGPDTAADQRRGIFIRKMADDSPAKGHLVPFMRVFAIDGQDMSASSRAEAVDCLKRSGAVVTFVVSSEPDNDGFGQFL